ncbi:uncharacterized protein BDR25DRAFT_307940 [Lindgomyces ingoldianus]|uniref:Uncharacterized protein n=1 Tax=Lindgomyces ingoldianus TaxID=673940 RepID=A0ACB6Q9D4_9PLEO|nr:uncharacterized protein BDR25DRAFT_307940 [Lindgomyces ingoldianus]KAF2463193.1 hypothetical protein BDR25DRAFT_307940 [Lindgomyces ingoldianus]
MFGNTTFETDANMPSDASKQIFNIKDLPTKSVILYPTRAHITREINNVLLKPGANEVEIYGLSPTVDEHSIQIEGQGAATIADMTVQFVPNRDIFEEIYPDDEDISDDEESDGSEYLDSDDEEEGIKKLSNELKNLQLGVLEAIETQNSATERLATLDKFAKSVTAEHNSPEEIHELLKKYEEDRATIFKVHSTATQKLADLKKQIKRKGHEKEKVGKEGKKQKEKAEKQKAKERRRKELQKAEKKKEVKYVKQERLRYWAKKVYKITLLLEGASLETPSSSRRGSIDEITLTQSPRLEAKGSKAAEIEGSATQTPISLLLSYVTKEAGWNPRYDLRISSLQKSATIIYRTEFLNRTSETWKDAKLSFSTSQTSYQGLDDVVPFMHAWRIKLSRYDNGDGGLLSAEEARKSRAGIKTTDFFNRSDLFGLDDNFIPAWHSKRPLQVQQASQAAQSKPNAGGLFGASSRKSGGGSFHPGFGSSNPYEQAQQTLGPQIHQETALSHTETQVERANIELSAGIQSARRSSRVPSLFGARTNKKESTSNNERDTYDPTIEDMDDDTADQPSAIEFEESSWEDSGLTATYDVPGVRTLIPSSMTRRHKIASLNASNIHLSHICVPKLRSAAFLRAKIRNPSSMVTLLRGSAGVTLDGSFLGNMNLPRVSPGQVFNLSLGVDPAIHVNYPKPIVHRSTQGIIFSKESAQVFTRSVWLNNTKSQPVELLVLDQIPVSEDERLRIVITTPRGLVKEGDSVKTGVSAKEGSSGAVSTSSSSMWGNAVAKLKKNGEVNWTVKIEKGQGCLLKLDYEARLPPSEKIVPA